MNFKSVCKCCKYYNTEDCQKCDNNEGFLNKNLPTVNEETQKPENIRRMDLYKDTVYKYRKKFNLMNWEVFVYGKVDYDNRGWCIADHKGKICKIGFDTNWICSSNTEDEEIIRVAFHEVMELFYSSMNAILFNHISEKKLQSVTHDIIRVMENVVLPSLEKNNV